MTTCELYAKIIAESELLQPALMRFISYASNIGPAAVVPEGPAPGPLCSNPLLWNKTICMHVYKITRWHPVQQTEGAVCLKLSMALAKSYEDAID